MSRVNIDPEQIKSVKASLDDMSGSIKDSSKLVSDDSMEKLLDSSEAIKTISKDLMTVVEHFNANMDGIATAFESVDIQLSDSIKEGQSLFDYKVSDQNLQSRQKMSMDKADNPYYSMLP